MEIEIIAGIVGFCILLIIVGSVGLKMIKERKEKHDKYF
jgi:hypothetical protein